jgi:septal ring factor EnvC (AmiA/AmiB activator)
MTSEDMEKQIKELTLKYEIEKQKNRKLQQEMEIIKQKLEKAAVQPKPPEQTIPVAPAVAPSAGARPGPRPTAATAAAAPPAGRGVDSDVTSFIDQGLRDSVAGMEVDDLRTKLETLNHRYKQAEQEKWDIARKNIELKEQLQRLKVKGVNLKKDIENLNERLDRKENQNFKSRLEITDLKKENNATEEMANEGQKQRENLERQIADIEERIEKERTKLKEERRLRDMVHADYQRHRDMLAEYETHWAAKIYNR